MSSKQTVRTISLTPELEALLVEKSRGEELNASRVVREALREYFAKSDTRGTVEDNDAAIRELSPEELAVARNLRLSPHQYLGGKARR